MFDVGCSMFVSGRLFGFAEHGAGRSMDGLEQDAPAPVKKLLLLSSLPTPTDVVFLIVFFIAVLPLRFLVVFDH
jgi:hypothetical protein